MLESRLLQVVLRLACIKLGGDPHLGFLETHCLSSLSESSFLCIEHPFPIITVKMKDAPVPRNSPAWLRKAEAAAQADQRKQPWKKYFPNATPIDLETNEPELVILTLENQVQKNGKSP